jgi:ATP-dependent DNA helicase RecQ
MTPQEALKKYFGFTKFRPLQREIVEAAMHGHDVFALMPTGAGKSLCYQLPAALLPGLTVVFSPLIALMKDQVDSLQATGIPATFVNSSLSFDEQQTRIHLARSGSTKLLYIAPERLGVPGFLRSLSEMNVSLFVIDEAHCISEWGHDFRSDYRTLFQLRAHLPDVPIMALTATANARVSVDIVEQLRLREPERFTASFDRPNLLYQMWPKRGAMGQLIGYMRSRKGESGIIYCMSRKSTEKLAASLCAEGFKAEAYHAGMTAHERNRVQENFDHERTDVIVATVAFGMGIDKSNIRFVVHYHLPKSIPSYYQETGRAGRDGLPSDCILFNGPSDRDILIQLFAEKPAQEYEHAVAELDRMIKFVDAHSCRRKLLLGYFGEVYAPENCGMCDNCKTEHAASGSFDGTRVAQMFLSCLVRVKQSFGSAHVIQILVGGGARKILDFRHNLLPTYGVGKDFSKEQWNHFVDQLERQHLLQREQLNLGGIRRASVLKVTDKGWEVLRNERTVMFEQPKSAERTSTADALLPVSNQTLFDALRSLRRSLADVRKVPPYVLFSDATLRQMAMRLPRDGAQFRSIPGIGELKARDYGSEFIAEIRRFVELHPEVQPSVTPIPAKAPVFKGATAELTRELFEEGKSIEEIAKLRGKTAGTIADHLSGYITSGEIKSIDSLIPPPRMEKICTAFREIGWDTLTPVRESLGPDYSWEELKIARAFFAKREEIGAG